MPETQKKRRRLRKHRRTDGYSRGEYRDEPDGILPHEFFCIYKSWEQTRMREPWERTRFLACCVLQPYSKKALKVTDVCRFEWDAERKATASAEESTRERFEELKRKAGM